MLLSHTPRFLSTCWLTQALVDGSWATLTPSDLNEGYATFLAALKTMDERAVPEYSPFDMDGIALRTALGLHPSPEPFPSGYDTGRAQAMICILHFQVLDYLLASDFHHRCPLSVLTPALPTFKHPKAAIRILKPLRAWDRVLESLQTKLEEQSEPAAEEAHEFTAQPESLSPMFALSRIEARTHKLKVFKNLQAMAAGLLWILELGSPGAPVLNGAGKLAMQPLSPLRDRYNNGSLSSEILKNLNLNPAKLLGPLSMAFTISPALLLCDIDLTTTHIDLEITEELSHRLLAAGPRPKALAYVEQCVRSVARGSGGPWSAEKNAIEQLPQLLQKRPTYQTQDLVIFRDHYAPAQPAAPTPLPAAAPTPVATVWFARTEPIPLPVGGHIFTALSRRPPVLAPADVEMTLLSDLPPTERVLIPPMNSAGEKCGLSVGPGTAPIKLAEEQSASNVAANMTPTGTPSSLKDLPRGSLGPPVPASADVEMTLISLAPVNSAQEKSALSAESASDVGPNTTTPPPAPNSPPSDLEDTLFNAPLTPDTLPTPLEPTDVQITPAPRRSSRVKPEQAANAKSTTVTTTTIKRKANPRARSTQAKRPRRFPGSPIEDTALEYFATLNQDDTDSVLDLEDDTEPHALGLDFWVNDLKDIGVVERSTTPEPVTALLPDGCTERVFDYLGHRGSDVEYKLIFDVRNSMAKINPQLHTMQLSEWDAMSDKDRVKLWGTGVDLFIYGLKPRKKVTDIRDQMTKDHRLDAPLPAVQGLRIPPPDRSDDDAEVDYTAAIRTTTLRTLLDEAEKPDGLVINGLKLPSGQILHTNLLMGRQVKPRSALDPNLPLSYSGFDLELVAYRQTNGLPGFAFTQPPYLEMSFEMIATWIYIYGPGEKFWTRGLPRNIPTGARNILHSCAFDDWQPDVASVESCDYDIVALPAGEGMYLQQPGHEHAVISTDTGGLDDDRLNRTASATLGGYFFCASRMRAAMCVTLHMVLLQHILANSEHATIRVFQHCGLCANNSVPTEYPLAQRSALAAYCPDLASSRGWLDIVYLNCMIILLPCLDRRNYVSRGTPQQEVKEAAAVCESYRSWRSWLPTQYRCMAGDRELHWETDIFSPCLLHLAEVIWRYHARTVAECGDSEVFQLFTPDEFKFRIHAALHSYNHDLASAFNQSCEDGGYGETNFFLFDGDEFSLVRNEL
ncbi:hypothetical protein C8R46DRAFT_1029157 [Mycena filopes]|nr:hypothetical protein C8R46DRAFT_1029157 [Mycena filopes]